MDLQQHWNSWKPSPSACGKAACAGLQILLRKGGVREPTFRPAAATFLLFPTSFHSSTNLLTPAANAKYQEVCIPASASAFVSIIRILGCSGEQNAN